MRKGGKISPEAARYTRWLREQLKKRGWTQTELSERTGLSLSGLSFILGNHREPGIRTVIRIADAMEMRMVFIPKDAGRKKEDGG